MLTSRVTVENDQIIAWIDKDGTAWIEQPFFPNTQNAWASEHDALTWADNWIEEFNNRPEPQPL